ncbi:microsomal signal peptidase 12 kDa subunit-domain-containing protein [Pavlovales sp. CCMP2436]|nr:microsomal signal peptidase 12 kDa subunit-domain-containing protein [Pavlovales sp. CCMP2436]
MSPRSACPTLALLLSRVPSRCDTQDFVGQLFCERTFQLFILLSGIIGWIVGYIQQDFKITCYFLAVGSGLSAAVCLPDWPFWNRHPLDWLPPRGYEPARKKPVVKEVDRKSHAGASGKKVQKSKKAQ